MRDRVNPYAFRPVADASVFLEPIGSHARQWDGKPILGIVSSIEVRFFYVTISDTGKIIKVRKSNCKSIDAAKDGYCVYRSMEEFNEEQERKTLYRDFMAGMRNSTNGAQLSYNALKSIRAIFVEEGILPEKS